jgi:tetrahydromethanopterin:alpha-L-glutamate ligase
MRPSGESVALGRSAARPRVGLITDPGDWHGRVLTAALAGHGIAAVPVELAACSFATDTASGVRIDGFGADLPDAMIVRSMAGGAFEAVTLRLGILHALRERGVLVWNDARAIERCVDKSTTSFLLARAGVATPPTWATESYDEARAIAARETAADPLVLKPLFGSQGRGLKLIRSADDLPLPAQVAGGVYYLQRFVGVERDGYFDFRLLVVRGRVIAAMQRHSRGWITNVKQGGRPVAVVVNDDMNSLAVRATEAVGADFAGVDILYGADERPVVLEVNSMPAWSGLQKVAPVNISALFAEHFAAALTAHGARGATA